MKFLVPNYSCLQNPWLGEYHPKSPFSMSSVLNWVCWTPPPEQNSWVRHGRDVVTGTGVMKGDRDLLLWNWEKNRTRTEKVEDMRSSQSCCWKFSVLEHNFLNFPKESSVSSSGSNMDCCTLKNKALFSFGNSELIYPTIVLHPGRF